MTITKVPSPNYSEGRMNYTPIAIVVHIMEGSLEGTDSWFSSTISKVSAHYGIGKNGDVHQYVDEANTAWHAGRVNAPSWSLIKPASNVMYINPNLYTLGIEHEGKEDTDWTDEMYQSSSSMIKQLSSKWNIPLDRNHIIGHHEIYSLKTCPGNKVDLNKLIALASGAPVQPVASNNPLKILQIGNATSIVRLNIRQSPNRNQPAVSTKDTGMRLAYDGFTTQGESVNGNSKWFYTTEGNWFWSGGVK